MLIPFCLPSSALYVVASALHHGFESHSLRHVFNNLAWVQSVNADLALETAGCAETREGRPAHGLLEPVDLEVSMVRAAVCSAKSPYAHKEALAR